MAQNEKPSKGKKKKGKHRNRPVHIPLDFEKAVIGLMKVKPKKEKPHE